MDLAGAAGISGIQETGDEGTATWAVPLCRRCPVLHMVGDQAGGPMFSGGIFEAWPGFHGENLGK